VYMRFQVPPLSSRLRSDHYNCICSKLASFRAHQASTHSPPVALFVPKLLPTIPVHLQVLPAALFHVAVAVEPTSRHVMLRFSITGLAIVRVASIAPNATVMNCILTVRIIKIRTLFRDIVYVQSRTKQRRVQARCNCSNICCYGFGRSLISLPSD
jgi:hypothetical protein